MITNPLKPAAPTTKEPATSKTSPDNTPQFGDKQVSDNKGEYVIENTKSHAQHSAPEAKDVHDRSISQPHADKSFTARQQGMPINRTIVKYLETASRAELDEYIDDHVGTQGAANLKQSLKDLVKYNETLDKDMARLNELSQKLQHQPLSEAESLEMKNLTHCHNYNLSHAQSWLSATQALTIEKGAMNKLTATLFRALSNRLADRHMNLADTISHYDIAMPDKEPISRSDRVSYNLLTARAALRAFKTMTKSLKDTNPDAYQKMRKIHAPLVEHCKALHRAAQLAERKTEIDPDNPQLELASFDGWTEGSDLAMNKADKKALPPEAVMQLKQQWDTESPTLPSSHGQISQRDMADLFIENQLEKLGIDSTQLPKFRTVYEPALIAEINHGEWHVIDKSLQFKIDDKMHTCRSTITPGAHLAKQFEKPYKNGVTYLDRLQTEHALNMAHTELTAEDGKVLFSGVRHGIIDSYNYNEERVSRFSNAQLAKMAGAIYDDRLRREGIVPAKQAKAQAMNRRRAVARIAYGIKTDPKERAGCIDEMRRLTSRKMARELLSAAIVSDPAKLETALSGQTVDIRMNSVALVTPDQLRTRFMRGGPKDEQLMLKYQVEALQSLSKESPVKLMIAGEDGKLKEVQVKVKMRTFNFGVNDYSLAKTVLPAHLPIWRKLMGWGFSASINNPHLRELLGPSAKKKLGGAVADKLQALRESGSSDARQQARLLEDAATQAKEIWRKRSFWSGNNEPYKMVSRLALISHLMDETTLFNCKSGKDRTGQLDAEVKYLAAVGHASGRIPVADAAHTDETRKMRTTFTLDAGNLELQRMNTGLPGYKLRNIPGLDAMRMDDTKAIYEGGSDFV